MINIDRGSGPGRSVPEARARARRLARNLDLALGILGFFTALAVIQTVVLEVKGQPAGFSALVLLGLLVVLWLVWRQRRRLDI